ncbi:hypothetical protein [Pseudomonas sp. CF161]|uniref:hypothetical protein n=1 Tax=Pseudomonas sp. CF161 TaxID=911241 RepID=UPI0003553074|nr:hypothetical protein [Pseudomonas sp. CF161]EPL03957.1 hypothetical protein CF161_29100 [Pseudomonas sp. CF161]
MSFSVGFPSAGAITINGKSPATIDALSKATADTASQVLGTDDEGKVKAGGASQAEEGSAQASDGGGNSIAVQILLKRMQELQEQLKQQQQQLAAAQAANYPTPEAKQTMVMAVQGQIADTNGALLEVSGRLVTELNKGSSSGSVISTTA